MLEKMFRIEDGWEAVKDYIPAEGAENTYYAHTWARKNEDGSYSVFAEYKGETFKKVFSEKRFKYEDGTRCSNSLATGLSSEVRSNGIEEGIISVFHREGIPTCHLRDFLQY